MSYDFERELKKLKFEDPENNLELLNQIKEKIIQRNPRVLEITSSNKFAADLFQVHVDEKWKLAQCRSIINQITKMSSGNLPFLTWKVTKEFILDISLFDQETGAVDWDTIVDSPNRFSSMEFFLNAKFAYTDNYRPIPLNGRRFLFATTPTLVRQAIELKIKSMLGIKSIINRNTTKAASVAISDLLRFLRENPKIAKLPVDVQTLIAINKWANGFTHTGITSYAWQSLEAIDFIEPMFAIKNDEIVNLEGFNYLNKEYSKQQLKRQLEKFFRLKGIEIQVTLHKHVT